eukprot:53692-Eustigmatos_ZCMA.PRE.1
MCHQDSDASEKRTAGIGLYRQSAIGPARGGFGSPLKASTASHLLFIVIDERVYMFDSGPGSQTALP